MGASIEPANLLIVTEYMPRGSVHDVLHDAVLGFVVCLLSLFVMLFSYCISFFVFSVIFVHQY